MAKSVGSGEGEFGVEDMGESVSLRSVKRERAMDPLPGMKYVGIDLFKA
jgi:hypothetical protein